MVLLLLPMGARRVMLWSATPRTSDMSPFTASQEAWLMARTVGVKLRVALGVIEVLGVVAAGGVHIARVHDRDFLRLGVELDLGVGIALRLAVALDVGHAVVGDAVGNAVGVAADDEVDKLGVDAVCKAARAGVRHNDDDVRVLGCNDGLDLRIELLNARVDVIRGDLGGHDVHGVVGDVADKRDLHTGLVNDDIVLDKGGAVRRTCIIEIIGQNGDIAVALDSPIS